MKGRKLEVIRLHCRYQLPKGSLYPPPGKAQGKLVTLHIGLGISGAAAICKSWSNEALFLTHHIPQDWVSTTKPLKRWKVMFRQRKLKQLQSSSPTKISKTQESHRTETSEQHNYICSNASDSPSMTSISNAANPQNAHKGTKVAKGGERRQEIHWSEGLFTVLNNQVLELVTL